MATTYKENSIDLSIIIPVYNTEAYLPNCLNSICSQIEMYGSKLEVWIVNDGSPDNSLAIMEEYQMKYPGFINIINKQNGGLSDARNAALDKATGRYVWFVDSDDAIESGAIRELMEVINSTNADYVFFNAYRVDAKGEVIDSFSHGCEQIESEVFMFTAKGVSTKFNKHMVWLRLFRKGFIDSLRFPVGITHEDIHFDLQLLARRPNVLYLDGIFYRHFFDNPDSITNTMNPVKHRHVLWTFNDLYEKFSKEDALIPFLQEYLTIAISTLYTRSYYLLSTKLSTADKHGLFIEYAQSIRKMCLAGKNQNITVNQSFSHKITYCLIKNNYIFLAYCISVLFIQAKLIYDVLSSARHSLLKN